MVLVIGDNTDLISMVLSEAGIDDRVVEISDGFLEILDEILDIKRGMQRMWETIQRIDEPDIPF